MLYDFLYKKLILLTQESSCLNEKYKCESGFLNKTLQNFGISYIRNRYFLSKKSFGSMVWFCRARKTQKPLDGF